MKQKTKIKVKVVKIKEAPKYKSIRIKVGHLGTSLMVDENGFVTGTLVFSNNIRFLKEAKFTTKQAADLFGKLSKELKKL